MTKGNLQIKAKRLKKILGAFLVGIVAQLGFLGSVDAQTTDPSPYCQVNDDCGFGDAIGEFKLGNFTNNSGGCDNDGSVTYFNNLDGPSACPGETLNGSVQIASTLTQGLAIWIDWDGDGDWNDSDEFAYASSNASTSHSFSIQVPSNATQGIKRMRAQVAFGKDNMSAGDSCSLAASYGEVEDYKFEVLDPSLPRTFQSFDNVTQITDSVGRNQNNARIIEGNLQFSSQGCASPTLDSVYVSTNGSDNPAQDIAWAHINLEGSSSSIGQPAQPGSTISERVNNPSGSFGIKVDETFNGSNAYISLAYKISRTATVGNDVDGTIDSIVVNGQTYIPSTQDPSGARPISQYIKHCDVSSNRSANYLYGIDSVKVGNKWFVTDPSQGSGPDWYHFFKDDSAVVYQNTTELATFVTGRLNGSVFRAFADWNNDGHFDTDNEELFITNEFLGATQQSINIPCRADTGLVKMRVVSDDGGSDRGDLPPCDGNGYGDGEMEDMYLYIKPQPEPVVNIDSRDTFYVNSEDSLNNGSSVYGDYTVSWDLNNDDVFEVQSENTTHVFNSTGSHHVQMRLSNDRCGNDLVDTVSKTIEVVQPPREPLAQFNALKYSTEIGRSIKFEDLSQYGASAWEWSVQPFIVEGDTTHEFVEGTSANSKNPEIQFNVAGTYSVQLVASNSQGNDTLIKDRYITVGSVNTLCADGQNTSGMSTEATGLLFDPGGPDGQYYENDLYDYDITCEYTISPDCADSVRITFEELDISNLNCTGGDPDYLRVYDGTSRNGVPLHQLKGYPKGFWNGNAPQTPITFTSKTGSLFIVFKKNNCGIGEGFRASWETFQGTDQATEDMLKSNQINGPDTVFRGDFGNFSSDFHLDGTQHSWRFPDGSRIVGSDSSASKRMEVTSGNYQIELISEYCGVIDTVVKTIFVKDVSNDPNADFSLSQARYSTADTLQFNDLSGNGILDWDWRIFPGNAVTYVNGTSPDSRNPEVVIDSVGGFSAELTVENRLGRDRETKLDYINIYEICEPGVTNPVSDLGINEVVIENMQGDSVYRVQSGYSTSGYSVFPNSPAIELEAGADYKVYINRSTNFNSVRHAIWLDGNKDGIFDSDDLIHQHPGTNARSYMDTISIPSNANEGLNWLRIASNSANRPMNGCGGNYSGEYEDHRIRIIGGSSDPDFDQTAPQITLNQGDSVTLSPCDTLSNYIGATAVDNVDGNVTNDIQINGNVDSSVAGFYTIIYQVSDSRDNSSSKEQTFEVLPDTSAPDLSLNGSATVNHNVFARYDDPGVIVNDNCGLDTMVVTNNVMDSIVGSYMVKYEAWDQAGNKATLNRTVNVVDNEAPQVALLGDDTTRVKVHAQYVEDSVFSTDNYYDSTFLTIQGQVDVNTIGTYELTYRVNDVAGNVTEVKRVVIVEDTQAPEFNNLPESVVVLNVHNQLNLDLGVTDNYNALSELSVTQSGSFYQAFPDGRADSLGTFTAKYTYEDESGNSSTATVNVEVVDQEAPVITLNNQLVAIPRFTEYDDDKGTTYQVSDNYYDAEDITVRRSGSYFNQYVQANYPGGLYEIRYTAVDPSGNESEVAVRGVDITSTSVGDEVEGIGVSVYPNPNNGKFELEVKLDQLGDVSVTVYDSKGKLVKDLDARDRVTNTTYPVDLSNFSSGVYNVKVQSGDDVVNKRVNVIK